MPALPPWANSPWTKWTAITVGSAIGLLLIFAVALEMSELKGPVARIAARSLGRPVTIEGSARLHVFTLAPRLTIAGLKVGQPDWARAKTDLPADMALVEGVLVEARLLPLLRGALVLSRVEIDRPMLALYRDKDGHSTWSTNADPEAAKNESTAPGKLPVIRNLTVRDGRLHMIDKLRGMVINGTIWSSEQADANSAEPFRFMGKGQLNNYPFTLEMTGGSLLHVDPDAPYDFKLDTEAGKTHIIAKGHIVRPFDLGGLEGRIAIRGDDLADLYAVTGLALPNTPPYDVSADIGRDGKIFILKNFSGTIGKSDVAGDISIDTAGPRPRLEAKLKSKRLDVADLGALTGSHLPGADHPQTPEAGKEKTDVPPRLLLPDARLDVARVRGMNAKLRYDADALRLSPSLAMKQVAIDLSLENGVLRLDPVTVELPQGRLSGHVALDARKDVPHADLDLTLKKARLENLVKWEGPEPAIEGLVQARATLQGNGASVHEVASHADGRLALVIPHGEIRQAFAELMGIDVAEGLSLLLSKDTRQVDMRCAVASFDAHDGKVQPQTFILDTDVVRVEGSGSLDLGSEAVDLELRGHPKHPTLKVRAPVVIDGTLRDPKIGVNAKALAAQAGVAGVAGALLTPLASLLAFIDPGLADDADCVALLAEAKQKGAPVPRSQ